MRYNTGAVTGTDKSMTIKHQMPSDEDFVLVFEIAMSGDVKDRLVIGNGTRAEFGDRQVHAGDAQVYDVTVSANDMGNGVTAIEYIGKASMTVMSAATTKLCSARSSTRSTATRTPKPPKRFRPPNDGSSRVALRTTSHDAGTFLRSTVEVVFTSLLEKSSCHETAIIVPVIQPATTSPATVRRITGPRRASRAPSPSRASP